MEEGPCSCPQGLLQAQSHLLQGEAEWTALKEKFFECLTLCQEEWRDIKENQPLQYMPYIEKHFNTTIGIKLNGLSDVMGWIKRGSYNME